MKKIIALTLALALILTAVSVFAEELPAFYKKTDKENDIETIIANGMADPMTVKEKYLFEDDCVAIPVPVVFKMTIAEPIKVYGNFITEVYRLNGDTLEYVSGGEEPGVFTLEKVDNVWKVTGQEVAADGEAFAADIQRFADGDENLLKQYQDVHQDNELIQATRIAYLWDYINQSHLDIEYYKLPGCDPVPII